MKRLLTMLFFVLALMSLILVAGCSDDDDNGVNTTTPGDPNDPDFLLFMESFDNVVDEAVSRGFYMTQETFIDSIITEGMATAAAKMIEPLDSVTLEWHGDSEYWYCTAAQQVEVGMIVYSTDSIRFYHGGNIVQWPHPDSMTEIRSYLAMSPDADNIDTALVKQDLVIQMLAAGSDTVVINGTTDVMVDMTETDIAFSDTTVYDYAMDYDVTLESLYMDTQGGEQPYDGRLTFTGSADVTRTGATEESISGIWNVVQTFNTDGTIDLTVTHGSTVWTILDW